MGFDPVPPGNWSENAFGARALAKHALAQIGDHEELRNLLKEIDAKWGFDLLLEKEKT